MAVEAEVLRRQFDALSAMRDVTIEYSPLGPVSSLIGPTGVKLPRSLREFREGSANPGLLSALAPLLLATGRETVIVKSNRNYGSMREIESTLAIDGIPVEDGVLTISIDERSGEVLAVVAAFLPDRGLHRKPKLSSGRAWLSLVRAMEASGDAVAGSLVLQDKPRLAYYGVQSIDVVPQLAWTFRASYRCPTGRSGDDTVWINAIDGSVAGRRPNGSHAHSPGPCQRDEMIEADCEIEPVPRDVMDTSCAIEAPPAPTVTRQGCSNEFHVTWPRAPGAYRYLVLRAPRKLGWSFARPVTQWYAHQCTITVDSPTMVRMQVCGRCSGCGPWSDISIADPQAACRPAEQR